MENLNLNFKLEKKLDISDNSIEDENSPEKNYSTVDRVVRILKHVRYQLDISLGNRDLLKNLNWVIKKIESNTLYSNIYEEIIDEENKYSEERTEFLEGFQEFSFVNDIKKQNRERMICKTAHQSEFNGYKNIRELLRNQKPSIAQDKMANKILSNESILNNVDEEEEINYIEDRKSKKKIQKSLTMKSCANGKVDNIMEIMPDEKIINFYETIKDEKVTNYKIGSVSPNSLQNSQEDFNMNTVVSSKFNIFNFESIFSREKLFPLIGNEVFRALDLINIIDSTKLTSFLYELRNNYIASNPYHNDRHGADVGQTVAAYIKESEIIDICLFQDIDILSMAIASLGHDVGHTGKNNNFHINSKSVYSFIYHDKSVLENYHIYVIFKLLKHEENDILSTLNKEEFVIIRKRIIEAVLATDMSFHSKVLSNIKNKLFNWNEIKKNNKEELFINPESKTLFEEQQEIINFIIHSADIAHNTKPFVLSEKWTELLTEEFHQQGDKEKSLEIPISFLCDRTTTNVPKSQIGFLSFVIIPTFELLVDVCPSLNYLLTTAKGNLKEWERMLKENEEKN